MPRPAGASCRCSWPPSINIGPNRTVSVSLRMVGDGAKIIRHYWLNGKGVQEELYLLVLRRNDDGVYRLDYLAQIDFSKTKDRPYTNEVEISLKEGGIQSYLDLNEHTIYNIDCTPNNPLTVPVCMDGVLLNDTYRYNINEFETYDQHPNDAIYSQFLGVGSVFISNEGDSVGILKGSKYPDSIGVSRGDIYSYAQTNNNYLF